MSYDHNFEESRSTCRERGAGILIKESSIEAIDVSQDSGKAGLIQNCYNLSVFIAYF